MNKNHREQGFSLVELLVVVIVIAIIAAIAIPNLLASRRAANDSSAISSLRTIHSAETTYYLAESRQYGTLIILSGLAYLDSSFGNIPVTKSGFRFVVNVSTNDVPISQLYCASAVPITPGSTGNKGYAVSEAGTIYRYDVPAEASAACASTGAFTIGNGVPIQ